MIIFIVSKTSVRIRLIHGEHVPQYLDLIVTKKTWQKKTSEMGICFGFHLENVQSTMREGCGGGNLLPSVQMTLGAFGFLPFLLHRLGPQSMDRCCPCLIYEFIPPSNVCRKCRHVQRCASWVILNPVKFKLKSGIGSLSAKRPGYHSGFLIKFET